MGQKVYKIMSRADWEAASSAGVYVGAPLDLADGYIHLSAGYQVAGTLAAHFAGRTDLVLVAFDAGALGEALRWEPSRGGALFPHLYAPLPVRDATDFAPLSRETTGAHVLPAWCAP
jgi:uncharacterized protein (DUF952 family)